MLKIRLALTAENDLENIWIYTITEWNEEQADKYLGLCRKVFRNQGQCTVFSN